MTLIEQLRKRAEILRLCGHDTDAELYEQAADRIEELEAKASGF